MVKTTQTDAPQQKYPVIKTDKRGSMAVLFSSSETGVVIFSNNPFYDVGYYSDNWFEKDFTMSNRSYTLENQ